MSTKKSGVYKITLKTDGRSYVGSTVNIANRWRDHKSAVNKKTKQVVACALAKYGIDSFLWEILEYCEIENLIEREQFYLDLYRPYADEGRGWNIRKIAHLNLGIVPSAESRQKMSDSQRARPPPSEETKQRMRENWHNNRDDNYYKQCSDRVSGDKNPSKRPEVAKKISESRKGQKWTNDPERKIRHAELHKQLKIDQWKNPKYRQKMLDTHLGATRSGEQKENMRAWQQRVYMLTKPDGTMCQMTSYELKTMCIELEFHWPNLLGTIKSGKLYKKGWRVDLLQEDK